MKPEVAELFSLYVNIIILMQKAVLQDAYDFKLPEERLIYLLCL